MRMVVLHAGCYGQQAYSGTDRVEVIALYVTGFEKRDLIAQIMILRYRRF